MRTGASSVRYYWRSTVAIRSSADYNWRWFVEEEGVRGRNERTANEATNPISMPTLEPVLDARDGSANMGPLESPRGSHIMHMEMLAGN